MGGSTNSNKSLEENTLNSPLLEQQQQPHSTTTSMSQNTVADGYSRTDQRIPIATSTTPVAPPLNFDYNDGVPPDNNGDIDDYGAVVEENDSSEDDSAANNNTNNNTNNGNTQPTGVEHHLPHPDHPHLQQTHEGEHRYDHGSLAALKITRSTKLFAICAALNSCNLGYDIGVNTGAGMLLQDSLGLSDVQLEVFMGSLNLFAMVGALSSHWISDRLGRRWSFRIAAVVFIFGTVIQSGAAGYASLMFGRVFVGLGVGFGLAVDPVVSLCLILLCSVLSILDFVLQFYLLLTLVLTTLLLTAHTLSTLSLCTYSTLVKSVKPHTEDN